MEIVKVTQVLAFYDGTLRSTCDTIKDFLFFFFSFFLGGIAESDRAIRAE
jgi:hypothetical protein